MDDTSQHTSTSMSGCMALVLLLYFMVIQIEVLPDVTYGNVDSP